MGCACGVEEQAGDPTKKPLATSYSSGANSSCNNVDANNHGRSAAAMSSQAVVAPLAVTPTTGTPTPTTATATATTTTTTTTGSNVTTKGVAQQAPQQQQQLPQLQRPAPLQFVAATATLVNQPLETEDSLQRMSTPSCADFRHEDDVSLQTLPWNKLSTALTNAWAGAKRAQRGDLLASLGVLSDFRKDCGPQPLLLAQRLLQSHRDPDNAEEQHQLFDAADFFRRCCGSMSMNTAQVEASVTALVTSVDTVLAGLFDATIFSTTTNNDLNGSAVGEDGRKTTGKDFNRAAASALAKFGADNEALLRAVTNSVAPSDTASASSSGLQQQPHAVETLLSTAKLSPTQKRLWTSVGECISVAFEVCLLLCTGFKLYLNGAAPGTPAPSALTSVKSRFWINKTNRGGGSLASGSISYFFSHVLFKFIGDFSCFTSVMELEQALEGLGALLCVVGAIPAGDPSFPGSKLDFGDPTKWLHLLPTPLLNAQALTVVLYCSCILARQQRLTLKGIQRSTALEQLLAELSAIKGGDSKLRSVSWKLDPRFANEAGEGHGPRKDFLAIVSDALCKPVGFPMDASEIGLRRMECRAGSVDAVIHHRGEAATVSSSLRIGAELTLRLASPPATTDSSPASATAIPTTFTCRIASIASSKQSTISVRLEQPLPAINAADPVQLGIVSIAAPVQPCFDREHRNALWLNAKLTDDILFSESGGVGRANGNGNGAGGHAGYEDDGFGPPPPNMMAAAVERQRLSNSSSSQPKLRELPPFSELYAKSSSCPAAHNTCRYFVAGWLLGTAGGINGVPLVGLHLPPAFFDVLRHLLITKSEMVPADFCIEQLLQVDESMHHAVISVTRMKRNDMIEYLKGMLDDDDDEHNNNNNNNNNKSQLSLDDKFKLAQQQRQLKSATDLSQVLALPGHLTRSLSQSILLIKNKAVLRTDAECAEFVIRRHIVYAMLYENYKSRFTAIADGFRASTLPTAHPSLFAAVDSTQLHAICTGASLDDASKDFTFSESFNLVFQVSEFRRLRYAFAFEKVCREVLEKGDTLLPGNNNSSSGANYPSSPTIAPSPVASKAKEGLIEFKRKCLAFCTGRTLVPPGTRSETISVMLIQSNSTSSSSVPASVIAQQIRGTLPTAHTCTNTLELPNYYESVLLDHAVATGKLSPSARLDEELRQKLWGLCETDAKMLRERVVSLLCKQLRVAAYDGLTFELDETESDVSRRRELPPPRITTITTTTHHSSHTAAAASKRKQQEEEEEEEFVAPAESEQASPSMSAPTAEDEEHPATVPSAASRAQPPQFDPDGDDDEMNIMHSRTAGSTKRAQPIQAKKNTTAADFDD